MSGLPDTDSQPTTPIACSLGVGDLRTQEQRWVELVRVAGTDRTATPEGVRLRFRADPHVERELRELVAVERTCCAWARWTVWVDGDGGVVMQARAADEGVAILHSMFPRGR